MLKIKWAYNLQKQLDEDSLKSLFGDAFKWTELPSCISKRVQFNFQDDSRVESFVRRWNFEYENAQWKNTRFGEGEGTGDPKIDIFSHVRGLSGCTPEHRV